MLNRILNTVVLPGLQYLAAMRVTNRGDNHLRWESFSVGKTVQTSRGRSVIKGICVTYVKEEDLIRFDAETVAGKKKPHRPQHYCEMLTKLPEQSVTLDINNG